MKKNLLRLVAVLACLGLIFNIARLVYIINLRASLHPAIQIEGNVNDMLAWTSFFAAFSLAVLMGTAFQLRKNANT